MSGWNLQASMDIEGRPPRPEGQGLEVHYQIVSPDYFKTLEIPLIRGRSFTRFDRDTLNPVVLINQSLAKKEFAGEDPLGKRIKLGGPGPWATIVGVVGDFRHYRLPQPMGPAVYYSYFGAPGYTQTLAIRTRGDPLDALPQVRGVLHELDPNLPAFQEQSLEQAVDRALWRQRLQGQVLGFFAALALLLAAVGIYGVISYGVTQRTREMGVRMALGASGSRVVRLVVRQGIVLALVGVGLGLAGALALTRVLARLLYDVPVTDLTTFIVVPLVLGGVAVVSSWLPARRAAKVDPLVAMRAE
jgi:putative ABC transport system permease protein